MSDIILEMKNITKEFSGVKALDDVNLSVERGEVHALCGENGAGKSTLMNILSGIYPYGEYTGDILYNGTECRFRDIRESERRGIVIIHQELALSPYLSVAENVFLGNEITSAKGVIDWHKTHQRAAEILECVGLAEENISIPVSKLSIGRQQLVEIAKALAKKVELLILDEPTASLNDEDSQKLLHIILSLKDQGITCIMISHKLNELSSVADSITVIRDGKTIETLKKGIDEISEDRIIKGMVGRELTNRYPPRERKIGGVAFEVKNWSVRHPDDPERAVINNVSFHVNAGEVVGFAGLMGAGRTELAMSIFGRAYGCNISGSLKKDGKELRLRCVKDAIRNGIAYASEDRKGYGLVLINDIRWNMTLASLPFRFSRKSVINKNDEIVASEEFRKKLNIKANSVQQTVGALSGGNQQKVVLSKWIMTGPDLLILDEPTRGIDVGAKYEIYEIINELAKQGKAVIFISSEMPELLGVCDRIYVLNQGEIAGELSREEFSQETIMKMILAHARKERPAI
ncbi:Xylose import ATP-binding protein XylG [Caprobacter fermentans]|uniref:Sugar ABC transporter ATP-binding protein n=1 Tax=Caproicibacter fermentans TaxID=2576756 RepID=A0A6N8I4Y7_9FIRM|nr:multiple monosaccharide ABC transporter ATP-binding protein [Caproicibacter fermentans]MVB12573.1 Xylose import ATP-binding protein XylG [Caproicibacter fermentans]OCN00021.1 ABC transporter ATP-binding protein [Clostridium sp. W14A]QNK39143.1 sugar ABC transporter ATP-binding protein [Caproicibacter fermentans]